ncbi:hypothetical protein [Kerstersia sp.]|uniref:hypothetical protein n=1 Tax=Kerstersia sp. TaxID=1930783 RepID=UPI003F91BCF0
MKTSSLRFAPALSMLAVSLILAGCGGGGSGGDSSSGGGSTPTPKPDPGQDTSYSSANVQGLASGTQLLISNRDNSAQRVTVTANGTINLAQAGLGSTPLSKLGFQASNSSSNQAYSDSVKGKARLQHCTAASGNAQELSIQCRDFLYFTMQYGNELWRTDGTTDGTTRVSLPVGANSTSYSHIESMTALQDGRILFPATTEKHGQELWISDGTESGTRLLHDINPDNQRQDEKERGSWPREFVRAGNWVYFSAREGGGQPASLWRSNGDVTEKVYGDASQIVMPQFSAVLGDQLYFLTFSHVNGKARTELWKTHPDSKKTEKVMKLSDEYAEDRKFTLLQRQQDRVYISWQNADGQKVLGYFVEGQDDKPVTVFNLDQWLADEFGEVDLRAAHITPVRAWKDQFYFELSVERVTDAGYQQITYRPEPNSAMMTRQLWRTDGKPAGTYRVPAPTDGGKEVYYAGTLNLSRHGYDGFMGKMHFGDLAMDPETEQFSAVSFYDIAWRRQLVGDKLFFYGIDSRPADGSGFVAALWVSDGTVAGTQLVKRPGSASGTTANIGVTSLSDFDARSSLSNELGGILNNKLVLSLDIKKAGRDDRYPSILVTDGTLDGTRVLKEIID